MDKFSREKQGFRFAFGGLKTNAAPDALASTKYPMAINVRGVEDDSTQTRPGLTLLFSAGATPNAQPTDLRAYTRLNTDNLPRVLARVADDTIWLDNGVLVGSLASAAAISPGASLIPFRPAQATVPWMYIANGSDYQKFSAPDAGNVITQQKVGMAEPQIPPVGLLLSGVFGAIIYRSHALTVFTPGGTAGAISSTNRLTDIVQAVIPNPDNANPNSSTTQVSSGKAYQRFMAITSAAVGFPQAVLDVFEAIAGSITIAGIYYFGGTTGRCVIVPQLASGGDPAASVYVQTGLSKLRHGSLIKIGTEVCYVISVTNGPDGSMCIETFTNNPHTTSDLLSGVPGIYGTLGPATTALTSPSDTFAVTAGIGTVTMPLANFAQGNPFVLGAPFFFPSFSLQDSDYLHISIKIDNPANLVEMKVLFDVGDGSFTKNFYYYTIRPSDITAALANTSTQLGIVQTVVQRALIDVEQGIAADSQGVTASSAQMQPGTSQWTEILVPIGSLTRVGNDQTVSLQNIVSMQLLFNAAGTVNCELNSIFTTGGSQPDVGDVGAPLRYRIRGRSTLTGVLGNPSPATRYGLNPRRNTVIVGVPGSDPDPQIDTWDIFRYGGAVTSWRYVGSAPISAGFFVDNFDDAAAQGGSALDFDNFEPWPSVGVPNNGTASLVIGTIAVVASADPSITSYLPGTLVQIGGQNVYTLWTRPTQISQGVYLLQFLESAGFATNVSFNIQEPLIARQFLPYMWGADAEGTVFACGNPLHAGTLYFAKNYAPDAASDQYNIEVSPPTEPLLGGEILDGLSFVASTERWWRLYPQGTAYLNPQNRVQHYSAVLQPIARGLAAPFGHCNDGTAFYWWAKDGIWSSAKGSLTDGDLYNLFPHEGVPGVSVSYGGLTVTPPDYSRAGTFRLCHANNFLYAIYQDATGTYRVLTYDTRHDAWVVDSYAFPITTAYHVEQPSGPLLTSGGSPYSILLFGGQEIVTTHVGPIITQTLLGKVFKQTDGTNDDTQPILCALASKEYDGGDIRTGEQWGDIYLDCLPAAKGAPLTLTPMFLGASAAAIQTIAQATARTQQPISVGGELTTNFLGVLLQWQDDFTQQAIPTVLYAWQPSFLPQPEPTIDRISNWDDGGSPGAKWVQGFVMEADTQGATKALAIQDADTLATHTFTPPVVHVGQSQHAYSFDTPFIAHMMRIKPTDTKTWRFWDIKWITEPTPETALTWKTQPSTHGLKGFMHIRQVSITYASTQPVTMAISVYDGVAPATVVLPATGGAVQKIVVPLTANKGQLYTYAFTSPATFQIYQDKCEVLVGAWGRQDDYTNKPLVGGTGGDEAKV